MVWCPRRAGGGPASAAVRETSSPWIRNFIGPSSISTRLVVVAFVGVHLVPCVHQIFQMSENQAEVPTYALKEIFCSYITSCSAPTTMPPRDRESLAMSMARLVRYAQTNAIATPFYGTKLGGKISSGCRYLFKDFQMKFEEEFEVLKMEEEYSGSANLSLGRLRHLVGHTDHIRLTRCTSEGATNMATNALIKSINCQLNIGHTIASIKQH